MKLSNRKIHNLPRSPEITINNYNPLLLMLWKANMDLQYIGESSLAIAQYVESILTKLNHRLSGIGRSILLLTGAILRLKIFPI